MIAVLIAVLLIGYNYSNASTVESVGDIVFDTTGWIVGIEGISYPVIADVAPFQYSVQLSDLSQAPWFGFEFLYLSITTATEFIDDIVGPGSFAFTAMPGETYFVNVFGVGAGEYLTGLFGVEITAVPIPATILLFGSGILGMVFLRRRKQ
jgi:hypothetical protein